MSVESPVALAIDSSSETTHVALRSRNGAILEASALCAAGGSHSEALSVMVERLLHDSGTTVSELELFVYGKGPGSFTGLRIGLSFLQGLNFTGRKLVIGICSLAAAAKEYARPNEILISAVKAAKGSVYLGVFESSDGSALSPILPPSVVPVSEMASLLSRFSTRKVSCVGVGTAELSNWKTPLHTGRSLLEMAAGEMTGAASKRISIEELAALPLEYVAPINAKTIAERVGNKY